MQDMFSNYVCPSNSINYPKLLSSGKKAPGAVGRGRRHPFHLEGLLQLEAVLRDQGQPEQAPAAAPS